VISSARGFAHSREITFRETCAASRDVDKFLTDITFRRITSHRVRLHRIIRRRQLFASLVPSSSGSLRVQTGSHARSHISSDFEASKLDSVVSASAKVSHSHPRETRRLALVAFVSLDLRERQQTVTSYLLRNFDPAFRNLRERLHYILHLHRNIKARSHRFAFPSGAISFGFVW